MLPHRDQFKPVRLEIDFGTEKRQVVAGIAEFYQADQLIEKEIPVLVNLEPRTIRGTESHGMILAADVEGKAVLLHPSFASKEDAFVVLFGVSCYNRVEYYSIVKRTPYNRHIVPRQ